MYPPHHLGGYELVWEEAVRHLRERGHPVRVLTTGFTLPGAPADEDPEVHRELDWYWEDHAWPSMRLRERIRLEHRNWAVLVHHLEDFQPDLVGWWSMGGMSLSLIERVRRRGIPAAGFVCDEWMLYGPKVDGWLRATRAPLFGALAERLTGIPTRLRLDESGPWLFPSEQLRSEAVGRWGLTGTEVVHQGVDQEVFHAAPRPAWSHRLLYAGRIDPRKGVDLAIAALPLLPAESTLEVVGHGDEAHLTELHDLAGRLGVADRVFFLAPERREQLRDRYARADALVFPVTWREPYGLVPLEAMAVGTPVIATGRGGSGEFLRDRENSLIFDPDGGPGELARAVIELARDPTLRARLVRGGMATSSEIPAGGFNAAVERTVQMAVDRTAATG